MCTWGGLACAPTTDRCCCAGDQMCGVCPRCAPGVGLPARRQLQDVAVLVSCAGCPCRLPVHRPAVGRGRPPLCCGSRLSDVSAPGLPAMPSAPCYGLPPPCWSGPDAPYQRRTLPTPHPAHTTVLPCRTRPMRCCPAVSRTRFTTSSSCCRPRSRCVLCCVSRLLHLRVGGCMWVAVDTVQLLPPKVQRLDWVWTGFCCGACW